PRGLLPSACQLNKQADSPCHPRGIAGSHDEDPTMPQPAEVELLPGNRTVTEATISRLLVSKDEEIRNAEAQEP
ncbi:hypothetical protein K7H20_19280, partial [Salipiger manganoxidans]|uniref:hypothetical protein n=1 Tax=Salipiger marinus TaxID=555512 RepID=UPI001E3CDDC2